MKTYKGFLISNTGTEEGFTWVAYRSPSNRNMNLVSYSAPTEMQLMLYIDDANDEGEYSPHDDTENTIAEGKEYMKRANTQQLRAIVRQALDDTADLEKQYDGGLMTPLELAERIEDIWMTAKNTIESMGG